MKRENMRVLVTKRMIREGLFRCLEKKTIEKISITELCEEAQVNRTTFYNHYERPEDVLKEISWEIVEKIENIYKECDSARVGTLQTLTYLRENSATLKQLFSDNAIYFVYETAIKAFSHFWDSLFDLRREYRLDNVRYDLTVTGYGWSGFHMIRKWILEDIDLEPEELLNLFDTIFGKRAS